MQIKQLECFAAAVEAGSFTKASDNMHIAQSAFSRHIRNLEIELGVELFVRKGRGVELTPEGVGAFERAQKLLADFTAFRRHMSEHDADKPLTTVTLAAHGGIGPLYLPKVARQIQRTSEHVQFRLVETLSEQIERHVSSGEFDIGVVIRRAGFQVERADMETIKLADDDMYAVGPSDQGGLVGEDWSADRILGNPLVLAPSGSLEHASFENWARQHGLTSLNIVGEATAVPTRIELARQIGAFCILPGIALADLLTGTNWQVHRIARDTYLEGIEWFLIYRRTEGDRVIRNVVEAMQQQVQLMVERNAKSLQYLV